MSHAQGMVKCLVWDLDNTLWQGTLLEDGAVALAEPARALLDTLDSRGILQAVVSKNDHDLAWAKLEELGVADYFVAARIGWGPKSTSVREIAEELKFALGTIAFVDDQPAERAEVTYHLPDVRCYTAEQLPDLAALPELNPRVVTADARRRREMYQAGVRRETAQENFAGADEDFLRSLELRMRIDRAGDEEITRVEELTLRTSQMNATGVHYPDEVLRSLLDDTRHEVLVASLTDRFGPHGAIGVLLLEKHPGTWRLKLLATSCRVVSFGVGAAIISWLTDQAARAGVHLVADFRRTDRNRMMEIAYRFSGFTDDACACVAGLDQADAEPRLLHLAPRRQQPSTTIELAAPDLAGAAVS